MDTSFHKVCTCPRAGGEKKLKKGSQFTTRSTWTGIEQEEHVQPHGRVETQTEQLSANEYVQEGKDRGASAQRSSRTQMQRPSSLEQKQPVELAVSSSTHVATSLPTSRAKGQAR